LWLLVLCYVAAMSIRSLALLLFLSSGCTSLAQVSAAHVGCPAEEITVSEKRSTWSAKNWVATCQGRRYQCAAVSTGEGTSQVNCTPETSGGETPTQTPPPVPATPARACVPNETQECFGPGRCAGAQSCTADGMSYTPCDCGPSTPASEPAGSAADPGDATP